LKSELQSEFSNAKATSMKYSAIILSIAAMLLASCGKSSTDTSRVRELEEENARLRRAAGQSAALVPAAEKPSKDVLDEAISEKHGAGNMPGGWKPTNIQYTVTNNYTRQIRDETFHVYEFDTTWTETFHFINGYDKEMDGQQRSQQAKDVIAFVKRGNKWFSGKAPQ
jgi:hypothetical protein